MALKLTRYTHAEARVVARLRLGAVRSLQNNTTDEQSGPAPDCFQRLAAYAASIGFEIWPPDAPYVADDELKVLGWIAYLQRVRTDGVVIVAPVLREHLEACAQVLNGASVLLPYRAALRTHFADAEEKDFRVRLGPSSGRSRRRAV